MTEYQLRSAVVANAKSLVGLKESDGSFRKIIDLYNSHTPLAQGYRVQYTDSWCATFVSAVAIACGLTDIIPTECSCPRQIALFQKLGCWKESDSYVPSPGDIIYYDWSDSGSGDDTASPDHVGIVVSVGGGAIKVIEGNRADAVGYRTISINGRYIRGFGVPAYAKKAGGTYTVPTSKNTTTAQTNTQTQTASSSAKGDYVTVKTWKNGSTEEPVYADTGKQVKIGSLNAYESCDCLGTADGLYIVRYRVDGTSRHKVGLVAYSGGVA